MRFCALTLTSPNTLDVLLLSLYSHLSKKLFYSQIPLTVACNQPNAKQAPWPAVRLFNASPESDVTFTVEIKLVLAFSFIVLLLTLPFSEKLRFSNYSSALMLYQKGEKRVFDQFQITKY